MVVEGCKSRGEVSSMGWFSLAGANGESFWVSLGWRSWHQRLGSTSGPERPSAERVYGVGSPSPIFDLTPCDRQNVSYWFPAEYISSSLVLSKSNCRALYAAHPGSVPENLVSASNARSTPRTSFQLHPICRLRIRLDSWDSSFFLIFYSPK